jgi:hypothetical protein
VKHVRLLLAGVEGCEKVAAQEKQVRVQEEEALHRMFCVVGNVLVDDVRCFRCFGGTNTQAPKASVGTWYACVGSVRSGSGFANFSAPSTKHKRSLIIFVAHKFGQIAA